MHRTLALPTPHTLACGHMQADKKLLYIATNMECSDLRLARMSKMLEQRAVRTVCAQEQARQELGSDDNYFLSVVEQARGTHTCTHTHRDLLHCAHTHCTCTVCALHDALHLRLLSLFIEQELCARAHTFIGSKYSTWTDTVSGMRIHEERPGNQRPGNNWLFEELYQLGVK